MIIYDIDDIENLVGSNDLNAFASFYWRALYKSFALPENLKPDSIDLWYKTIFYGRIDNNNNPIYPREDTAKQLVAEETIFAINFVADAWKDFRKVIEDSLRLGNLHSPTMYSSMEPVRGLENIHLFYHEWNAKMYETFSGGFMIPARDRKVEDFKSFMKVYAEFSDSLLESFPATMGSLILSKWCSPAISGLMIEIADGEYDDDEVKLKFINDVNFSEVVKAASRFGFKVDKNAPWRFVADLDSAKMKEYMSKNDIDNKKSAHDNLYLRSYENDFAIFKYYLLAWYNQYVGDNPLSSTVKAKGCSESTTPFLSKRETITPEHANETISEGNWLRLYLYVKAKESRKNWNQSKFDQVHKRTMELILHRGKNAGMKYLHRMTKKDRNHHHFTENPLTKEEVDAKIRRNTAMKRGGSFNF
jgi:hypothetical protein